MLTDLVTWLRCPLCGDRFEQASATLRCAHGHAFDVARQGYVNLLTGPAPKGADTPAMVDARSELLDAGHFDFLRDAVATAVAEEVPDRDPGLVLDIGAGTGHYLAAVLGRRAGWAGLALDIAKPAARRAASAHPRAGAAVCDVWHGLPLAPGCADAVLDVFAPRNPVEFHRVLRPDGVLVVVTPDPRHLTELAEPLGLLGMAPDKDDRVDEALRWRFRPVREHRYSRQLTLTRADAVRLAWMGPAAFHHTRANLLARAEQLPEPVTVTAAVHLRVFRPVGEWNA